MRYRVDDVPWHWRPFWLAWSWLVALAWGALLVVLNATCRVRNDGVEQLPDGGHGVYSFWHESLGIFFAAFLRKQRGFVWMQHPASYMKPVHIMLGLMGVRIVLGSSGEEGRAAAARLTELVREGASTVITPDGPKGPPHQLKKGVLHIAAGSGVPVIPLRLTARPALRFRTWDGKVLPLPFSRITVHYGTPVAVTEENFEEAASQLERAMTAPS